ncbi:hypothetical protein Tco_1372528 [Tanacetum coccineum]
MATTSNPDTLHEDKGNMVIAEPEITDIADLSPTHSDKTIEVIVYRKWTSKHIHTQQPIKVLQYKRIRDVQDTEYFNQLLRINRAFLGFSCEQTGPWEQTLQNCTSLIFGRFTNLQEISNVGFPEHYFNFAAYNELQAIANVKNAILTGYIGRIQAVSMINTSGDTTTNRIHRKTIDIQNLRDGNGAGNIGDCIHHPHPLFSLPIPIPTAIPIGESFYTSPSPMRIRDPHGDSGIFCL